MPGPMWSQPPSLRRGGSSPRRNRIGPGSFQPRNMAHPNHQNAFNRIGGMVSGWVSDIASTPAAQIGVILVCAIWFAGGFATDLLTAFLSIMAITLTQMVLNHQNEREIDAHRRDVAMHAKLDELVAAMKGARNDLVGVEELDEEEIVQLKEEVKEAIEDLPETHDAKARETARRAVEEAADELTRESRKRRSARARPAKS